MRFRVLSAAAGLLTMTVAVYGQSTLTGKWQTDNVAAALEAQKNAPPAEEGGARGGRGRGGGGQAIIMDLQQDSSGKITGTVTEIGNPPVLNIEDGMIDGKTVKWVTQPRGVTWNLEFTDDNTLTLTGRTFAGRGGVGAAKGPAPETAPGGGAPPAGDGAPRGGGRARGPQQPIVLHRAK